MTDRQTPDKPQTQKAEVRLHYRDVNALINLIENDYQLNELSSEEKHAYYRLKEIRAAQEAFTAYKERMALRHDDAKI